MNKHFFLNICMLVQLYINKHTQHVNKNLFVFWMRLIVWQHYFIVIYLPVGPILRCENMQTESRNPVIKMEFTV